MDESVLFIYKEQPSEQNCHCLTTVKKKDGFRKRDTGLRLDAVLKFRLWVAAVSTGKKNVSHTTR